MTFFKRIFKKVEDQPEKPAEKDWSDRRIHPRYPLLSAVGFIVQNKLQLSIIDLSYSGLACQLSAHDHVNLHIAEPWDLALFGQVKKVKLIPVYQTPNKCGMMFSHDEPESLIFLRPFLERMREGSNSQIIPKENLAERFQSGTWVCIRGMISPIDLMFSIDDGQLKEMIFTFPSKGDTYHEISFRQDKWQTANTLQQRGLAAQVMPSRDLDVSILQQGGCLLLGIIATHELPNIKTLFYQLKEKIG